MKIFAVSDLHLSGDCPKPMDIFGANWENHWEKIQDDWRCRVGDNDLVLIGGDISWAMTLEQAKVDLDQIDEKLDVLADKLEDKLEGFFGRK